jgi:glyoxylase I family protein
VEKVTGIGGMFFRAEDPEALRGWYADTLGVVDPPNGIWCQEEGLTVFAPFSKDTDYFGRRDQTSKKKVPGGSRGSSTWRATA